MFGRPRWSQGTKRRVALGITLFAAVAIGDYWLFPVLARPGGKVVNRNENGLWLRYTWYFGEHRPADLKGLAERMERHGVRDAFFHVRSIEEDGSLNFRRPDQARKLNQDLGRLSPNVRKIAWIYAGNPSGRGRVDLANPKVRSKMVQEANWLVAQAGFDGVQWDYEICPDGDPNLLKLLEETRQALPESVFLGAAVPAWYPPPLSGFGWSASYFRAVAERCDQVAVMTYDTAAYSPRLYAWYVSEQVARVTRAVAGTHCKVLMGLPTYGDGTLSHNPHAENLRISLLGVRQGLETACLEAWQGVALFADYTTTPSEWKEFEELWPREK